MSRPSLPPTRPSRWQPAFAVLAVLTAISLLLNVGLLAAGSSLYRQVAPLRQAAAGLGRSLRQAAEEPLAFSFPIQQRLPLRLDLPIDRTIEINVNTTIPVDTAIHIDTTLPVVGRLVQDIPIHVDVPIDVQAPIAVSTTVPISVSIPISLTLPVAIDLQSLPIGGDLLELGTALEGIAPAEDRP